MSKKAPTANININIWNIVAKIMFCIQLVGLCLINSKDFCVFSTIFKEDSLYSVEWLQFDKKVKNRCRGIFLILLYDGSIPVCMYLQLDVIFLLRTQLECIG